MLTKPTPNPPNTNQQREEASLARGETLEPEDSEDEDDIVDMDDDEVLQLTHVRKKYRNKAGEVKWKIIEDGGVVTVGTPPAKNTFDVHDTDIDFDQPIKDVFFKYMFANIEGHARLMHDYHSDKRSSNYDTYKDCGFTMMDLTSDDEDSQIKICYLLMAAAATEVERGVDNLFKKGPSGGRHHYPDFGKHINVLYYKLFIAAAPFMWGEKKNWYCRKDEIPAAVFKPLFVNLHGKRKDLLEGMVKLLIIDETIWEWKPKTSKHGGAFHLVFEPRKPKDMGIMNHDSIECSSNLMVYRDFVEAPEVQRQKKYSGQPSHLPCKTKIDQGTAVMCRQVEGSHLAKEGHALGDAYFGSVMCAVELKKLFGVESTFIVKGHTYLFPKSSLLAIMNARHKGKCVGNSVSMTITIAGVDLLASVYAWSKAGRAFLISSGASTAVAADPYTSHYEDEFGTVQKKEIPRPQVFDVYYAHNWKIDEFNRQRQGTIRLERSWPTQKVFFRMLTSVFSECLVDAHRIYKAYDSDVYGKMGVIKFIDLLVGELPVKASRAGAAAGLTNGIAGAAAKPLIATPSRKTVNKKRKLDGTGVGSSHQQSCHVCRRYYEKYRFTSYKCPECKTPLCFVDRRHGNGNETGFPKRFKTCYDEHLNSDMPGVRCNRKRKRQMPGKCHHQNRATGKD